VLFEVPGNGHNDAVVIMFLLAAIYLFVRARRTAVIPALMAGALAKFVPVLLVPIAAAAIWRDRARLRGRKGTGAGNSISSRGALGTLVITALAAVALIVGFYTPFWAGWESIGALGRQNLFTASIPTVLQDVLVRDLEMDMPTGQSLVRNGALALVALVTLWLAWRIFRSRNAVTPDERDRLVGRTLSSFYEVIFVYLAFATLWFQPWYLMWLVALTAPLAGYTYANRTLLFCIGGVANYFVWDFLWLWNRTEVRNIQITAALVVYTLPLFYSLYVWLSPVWRGREAVAHVEQEEETARFETSRDTAETDSGIRTQSVPVQQPTP
jgi:hypothetical protein